MIKNEERKKEKKRGGGEPSLTLTYEKFLENRISILCPDCCCHRERLGFTWQKSTSRAWNAGERCWKGSGFGFSIKMYPGRRIQAACELIRTCFPLEESPGPSRPGWHHPCTACRGPGTYRPRGWWWWFPEKKAPSRPGCRPAPPGHTGWTCWGCPGCKSHCPPWCRYWWCWTGSCPRCCTPGNQSGSHG